jgi:hypothetical protein
MMRKHIKQGIVFFLLVGGSACAHADDSFLYGGLGYVNVDYKLDSGIQPGDRRHGVKVVFGEDKTDYIGGELQYLNYDSYGYKNGNSEPGTVNAQSLAYSILLKYPVTSYVEPFLKLGIHGWQADFVDASSNTSEVDGVDALFGAGLNVHLVHDWSARLEYERMTFDYDDDQAKLDILSLTILRKF